MRAKTGTAIAALLTLATPAVAGAQEAAPFTLVPTFPGVVVEAGDTASFDVDVTATTTRTLDLAVQGLPDGWDAAIRGGGAIVSRVTARANEPTAIEVDVEVPLDAAEADYDLTLVAADGGLETETALRVTVQAGAGGDVVLVPEFPGLRGPADATFTFDVQVDNQTPEEVQLELTASGPQGWRVEARPAGESQASTVTVAAGSRERVTLEARPPVTVQSGIYEVTLSVTGSGVSQDLPLTVQITGDVAIEISTSDQRLNATVSAGEPSVIPLVVINTGTAPLSDVQLTSTAPRDWEVTFSPEAIPTLAAGEVAAVEATVTPAADALAGDYRVTFRTTVDQASDSVEVRTTVDPSTVWGLVGVGVIALTFVGLAGVFRKFGRR